MKVVSEIVVVVGMLLGCLGVSAVPVGAGGGLTRKGGSTGRGAVPKAADVPPGGTAPAPLPATSVGVSAAAGLVEDETDVPSAAPLGPPAVVGGEPSDSDGADVDPAEWFDAMVPGFLQPSEFSSFDDWYDERFKSYKSSGLRSLLRGGKASTMTDFFRLLEFIAPPEVYMKFAEDAIVWTSVRRRAAARAIKKGELERAQQEFAQLYGGRMSSRRLREAWTGVQRGIDEGWNHVLSDAEKKFRQKAHGYAQNLGGMGMAGAAGVAAAYAAARMDSDTESDEEEEKKRKRRKPNNGMSQSTGKKGGAWSDEEEEDDGGGKPKAI